MIRPIFTVSLLVSAEALAMAQAVPGVTLSVPDLVALSGGPTAAVLIAGKYLIGELRSVRSEASKERGRIWEQLDELESKVDKMTPAKEEIADVRRALDRVADQTTVVTAGLQQRLDEHIARNHGGRP